MANAVAEVAARENLAKPKVLAVTLLTSIDQGTLNQIGIDDVPKIAVGRLAKLARESGLDGVVASAQEIEIIRESVSQPDFRIVTPGIRRATDAAQDQRRTMTAAEARDVLGATRKYILPLLEHMDALRITRRVGDARVLGPGADVVLHEG